MVNHKNNKIIDAIESREIAELQKWLNKYPNLKIVSRDGSVIYKTAIELANPNIIQVSDRFHLIKGLSEAIHKVLRNELPRQIIIDEISIDFSKKTLKDRYYNAKNDIGNGMCVTKACENNGLNIRTFKRLIEFNEKEFKEYFRDKKLEGRQEKLASKNELIKKVKKLHMDGVPKKRIAMELKLDRKTIASYINSDELTIDNTSRQTMNSCSKYDKTIKDMVIEGASVKAIYKAIEKLGYDGKYGMVKYYVSNIVKSKAITYKKTVARKDFIMLLFKGLRECTGFDRISMITIYKNYPLAKGLVGLMKEFKNILLKTKNINALNKWFSKAKLLNLSPLNSFITGCMNDLDAVYNSIKYMHSNGVVEASVNKIKLNKRIMYGRCSFDLLKSKTLRLEFLR